MIPEEKLSDGDRIDRWEAERSTMALLQTELSQLALSLPGASKDRASFVADELEVIARVLRSKVMYDLME